MQKRYRRQSCCICMIVIFLIGIFGQRNDVKQFPFAVQMQTETETADVVAVSFLSAERQTGMDDFHITADTGRTISGIHARVRGATLYVAALLLLCFLGSIPPKRRSRFREKRISVFRIVTFIHRIDGKKKTCFDWKRESKQEVISNGNRYKIQNFVYR